ncbi:hypothetical protein TNCV_2889771 [Trichonephila clavipes]|nr:hypothetical protein TNCV_2889771 [Trichonephila clavipes]
MTLPHFFLLSIRKYPSRRSNGTLFVGGAFRVLLLAVPDHLWPSKKKSFLGKREKSAHFPVKVGRCENGSPELFSNSPPCLKEWNSVKLI